MESREFDTSTVEGIERAERYQWRLYGKYDKVTVTPIGFYRVRITGRASDATNHKGNRG